MDRSLRHSLNLCLIVFGVFLFKSTTAQVIKNDGIIINQWAPKPIEVDGQLKDWNDSLQYFNEDTQFAFNLLNDDKTLYLAIKSKNKDNLNRILARGISFSVNTEGKKKPGSTVIFPVMERTSQPVKTVKGQVDVKEMQAQTLSRMRRINVTGFAEILDGSISMDNTYGIAAAASFDSENNLIAEIAIPFHLLGITNNHELIAVLIEINGIKQPRSAYNPNRDSRSGMYGYPSRDYRYDRRPVINKQNTASGFWIKSTLAKK
ncbi:MAG TPA: hypothetical protein VLZ28_07365 [Daejeonella sp.]|nr:hypothetical protein [Daejeonella sp.]